MRCIFLMLVVETKVSRRLVVVVDVSEIDDDSQLRGHYQQLAPALPCNCSTTFLTDCLYSTSTSLWPFFNDISRSLVLT